MDDTPEADPTPAPRQGYDVRVRLSQEDAVELALDFQNAENNDENEDGQHYG